MEGQEEMIDGMKACCREQANLFLFEQSANFEVFKCSVCGCRHFGMHVEAGKMIAELTG